ncbi:ABC transporter ATP-binding protein [Roseisalinus antarcticus]|uniref:Spermidine/putrescine import ATP-binding protein PotA n=1 Tax=Roseisalinus antarcticus TaxID=254357 RepID=A0A1Y5RFH1_9RHOB|nr:ABC transporter ATP-binding protein [Roseisalinus antarcticus]SLN15920.1 Spermidine/putrescine import ATP-binding protein PotA [Roseisalinus antarcticus]
MRDMTDDIAISLKAISKSYGGGVDAVSNLDLDIREGEFFSLLGPSGCGKTTTLRMIAGFEEPTAGRIGLGGRDVTWAPPHKRDMGLVFQNDALFPHRTVHQNVAFGLRMRRLPAAEIAARVAAALAQVQLTGFEARHPGQLSGGQQQRVALARAIVIRPRVLLCDEPLGALDRKLRASMQFELKELQRELGVTLIYVTHDQEEALTMSDRIAVMNGGRIEQVAAPDTIYNRPATRFVADFIGEATLLSGAVVRGAEGVHLALSGGLRLPLPGSMAPMAGAERTVAIRPERITFSGDGAGLPGHIVDANFLGTATLYKTRLDNGALALVRLPAASGEARPGPGDRVALSIPPDAIVPVASGPAADGDPA